MNMLERLVGIRVKELREARGMTQESFANSIGMSRSHLAEAEAGSRSITMGTLERIFIGLEVSSVEFYTSPLFDGFPGEKDSVLPARNDYYLAGKKQKRG